MVFGLFHDYLKDWNQRFLNFFLCSKFPSQGPSTLKKIKKQHWFLPLRQTVHCVLAKMDFFPHFSTVCGGSLKVDLPRRKTNYRVQRALSAAQSQISCTLGPRKQAERNWFHISWSSCYKFPPLIYCPGSSIFFSIFFSD